MSASLADWPHRGVDVVNPDDGPGPTGATTPTARRASANSRSSAARTVTSVTLRAWSARAVRSLACWVSASKRCSASTLPAPSSAATRWARLTVARAERLNRSNTATPSGLEAGGAQAGTVLLVDGLAGHVESLRDASPRPALFDGALHVVSFEAGGQLAGGGDCTPTLIGIKIVRRRHRRDTGHTSNLG